MTGCEGVCSTCPWHEIEEQMKKKMKEAKEQIEKAGKYSAAEKAKAEKA